MTDQLSEELQYSQALVAPLLACLQALSKQVAEAQAAVAAAAAGGADALRLLLSNVQLVASIFYSLNSPGLTDVRWLGAPLAALPAAGCRASVGAGQGCAAAATDPPCTLQTTCTAGVRGEPGRVDGGVAHVPDAGRARPGGERPGARERGGRRQGAGGCGWAVEEGGRSRG